MIRTKTLMLIGALMIVSMARIAGAEEEPIDLTVVPQATPAPIPYEDPRPVEIREHDLNEKDVERIARLVWGSPARTKESKVTLIWCVMNRLNEPTGFFGDSITKVVNQSEFAWFNPHDHRSEENLRLVRDEMNRYLSWKVDKLNVGKHPSGRIYYIRSSEADRTILEGSEHLSPWKTLGWVP